jgi:hypothetical protein
VGKAHSQEWLCYRIPEGGAGQGNGARSGRCLAAGSSPIERLAFPGKSCRAEARRYTGKGKAFSGMTTETDGRGRGYWDEEKSTQPGVAVLLDPG